MDILSNYQRKEILMNTKTHRGSVLLSAPGKVLNIINMDMLKMEIDSKPRDH